MSLTTDLLAMNLRLATARRRELLAENETALKALTSRYDRIVAEMAVLEHENRQLREALGLNKREGDGR